MSEMAIPQRDSTLRPWLITLGLVLAGIIGYHYAQHPQQHFTFPPAVEKPVRWYIVLRMPPITSQRESGIETMKLRYGKWLDTLTRAGFRPARFSDVHQMYRSGTGLPEKSVIITFDPGLRRTYEIVSPIFAQHRWPAVWLSDESAMKNHHREYVTYHTARKMVNSELWDVGLKNNDGTYSFSIGQNNNFNLGRKGRPAWAQTSGSTAFNNNDELSNLNRLNVIADWTPQDLLNRVSAEVPVQEPVYLTVGQVQNATWGTSLPQTTADFNSARFNLGVGRHRKSTIVSWFGTQGIDNFKATVNAASLTGTLAFRFRWDEVQGNGIQVAVSDEYVRVEQRYNFEGELLYSIPRNGNKDFKVQFLVVGDRMAIAVDNGETNELTFNAVDEEGQGMAAVYLSDRITEMAHVNDLQIAFDPLPKGSVAWPPTL